MDIFDLCEQEAIQYYEEYGIDLSTKEKRLALDAQTKEQVFQFLAGRLVAHQFGM